MIDLTDWAGWVYLAALAIIAIAGWREINKKGG